MRSRQRASNRARVLLVLALLLAAWGCGAERSDSRGPSDNRASTPDQTATDHAAQPETQATEVGSAAEGTPVGEPATGSAAADRSALAEGQRVSGSVAPQASTQRYTSETVTRVLTNAPRYAQPELPHPGERPASPALQLVDLNGQQLDLAELRGQVVLLAFWATWCRPCVMEIPHLVHLSDTYADAGFKILGLSVDRSGLAVVKPFVARRPEINYPIIPNGVPAAMEFGGIRSIPTSFLLDRQGRVIRAFVGLQPPEILEAYVQAALREAA